MKDNKIPIQKKKTPKNEGDNRANLRPVHKQALLFKLEKDNIRLPPNRISLESLMLLFDKSHMLLCDLQLETCCCLIKLLTICTYRCVYALLY